MLFTSTIDAALNAIATQSLRHNDGMGDMGGFGAMGGMGSPMGGMGGMGMSGMGGMGGMNGMGVSGVGIAAAAPAPHPATVSGSARRQPAGGTFTIDQFNLAANRAKTELQRYAWRFGRCRDPNALASTRVWRAWGFAGT